jgi:hypothetical protein
LENENNNLKRNYDYLKREFDSLQGDLDASENLIDNMKEIVCALVCYLFASRDNVCFFFDIYL